MSTTTIQTLTTEDLRSANQALSDEFYANEPEDRTERSAARRELVFAQAANTRLWQAGLRQDNLDNRVGDKAAQRIFDLAWEEGHSEGYGRVEAVYEELAEIANLVIAGE